MNNPSAKPATRAVLVVTGIVVCWLFFSTYESKINPQVSQSSSSPITENAESRTLPRGDLPRANTAIQAVDFVGVSTIETAATNGLYRLSAADFWSLARDGRSLEMRDLACQIAGCQQYAIQSKHKDRAITTFFATKYDAEFTKHYCGDLIKNYGAREFSEQFSNFIDGCNDRSRRSQEKLQTINGLVAESDILKLLRGSASSSELYNATLAAIDTEQGIEGIDFDTLKTFQSAGTRNLEQRLTPFLDLLATKFGCRIAGYCSAGSIALLDICSRLAYAMVCIPGDNIESIAERNLSPIQFAMWRQAKLK